MEATVDAPSFYLLAADTILLLHALFIAFILSGQVLIVIGSVRSWLWVRSPWFRIAHLAAIGVVTVQAWFGAICPLTKWEMALRLKAGGVVYTGSFLSHWLEALIYYRAPVWVFALCYTAFAGVVVASWVTVRPRPFRRSSVIERHGP
jgi:hypothetical protein